MRDDYLQTRSIRHYCLTEENLVYPDCCKNLETL